MVVGAAVVVDASLVVVDSSVVVVGAAVVVDASLVVVGAAVVDVGSAARFTRVAGVLLVASLGGGGCVVVVVGAAAAASSARAASVIIGSVDVGPFSSPPGTFDDGGAVASVTSVTSVVSDPSPGRSAAVSSVADEVEPQAEASRASPTTSEDPVRELVRMRDMGPPGGERVVHSHHPPIGNDGPRDIHPDHVAPHTTNHQNEANFPHNE